MIENKIQITNTYINYKHYFDYDNYYTILILHGWGGSSDSWTNFGKMIFENGYNVIIPDLPGFGKTKIDKIYTLYDYAKLIEDFIQELKLDNIILFGHSNGGAISIILENNGILLPESLVLNNSAGIRNNKKRSIKRKILNNLVSFSKKIPFIQKIPNKYKNKFRYYFYKIIGANDYLESEKNNYLKQTYLNMIKSDLTYNIKKIQTNSLLIRGEKDTYTPLSDGQKMRKLIKNSKIIVLENQTHGIHLKNPELLLNTFLKNI